jgi:hypothetical protein
VESRGRTARAVRVGAMLLIVLLAFAAGLALRGWDDKRAGAAPAAPTPLREARAAGSIQLERADPGALRRPPRRAAPAATARPVSATGPVAAPAPPAPPAPSPPVFVAPPSSPPPAAEETEPMPQDDSVGSFDSEE